MSALIFNITKIKLMRSESRWGKPEGLLLGCSVGYLELRRLKLKYTWQRTPCLPVQIIEGWLPTGSKNFDYDGG